MRLLVLSAVLLSLLLFASLAIAQDSDSESQTVSCNFADGNQISVQFIPAGKGKEEPKNGKIWEPGGAPMTLYTQVPVVLNNVQIPIGAFSMYVIPNKKEWTLIVNKNVTAGSKYDEAQDLARSPMELGNLSQPVKPLQVVLAHMGPKLCSIRLYYGTVGVLTEFTEK
jgi:hypothetical protein